MNRSTANQVRSTVGPGLYAGSTRLVTGRQSFAGGRGPGRPSRSVLMDRRTIPPLLKEIKPDFLTAAGLTAVAFVVSPDCPQPTLAGGRSTKWVAREQG